MTESAHEQRLIRLLEEIADTMHSLDRGITAVVAVIEVNTDKVAGAVYESFDEVMAAVELIWGQTSESTCCSENPGANDGCCPSM